MKEEKLTINIKYTQLKDKSSDDLSYQGTTCSVDAWAHAQIVTCFMFVFAHVWIWYIYIYITQKECVRAAGQVWLRLCKEAREYLEPTEEIQDSTAF
jgi:hypothetical protein